MSIKYLKQKENFKYLLFLYEVANGSYQAPELFIDLALA